MARCGQRGDAIRTGKRLIELYGSDAQKKELVEDLKQNIAKIEREDRICRQGERYNHSFTTKNWAEFFTISKEIIAEEGNSPLALDVMLALVSVGFDLTSVDKIDTFNNDTLFYAKLSIQQIEAGQNSQGIWGVFNAAFRNREDALSWMNYITGWILYHKMNRQKEALGYYYKATQIGKEKKNEINIYTNIGSYYFDEAVRLDSEYREKRKANNEDTDETKALLALARGTADLAAFYFARAYKIALVSENQPNQPKQLKGALFKTLTDLYRFRFNIDKVDPLKLDLYIEDLNNQPLPDSSMPLQPILENPGEINPKRDRQK